MKTTTDLISHCDWFDLTWLVEYWGSKKWTITNDKTKKKVVYGNGVLDTRVK